MGPNLFFICYFFFLITLKFPRGICSSIHLQFGWVIFHWFLSSSQVIAAFTPNHLSLPPNNSIIIITIIIKTIIHHHQPPLLPISPLRPYFSKSRSGESGVLCLTKLKFRKKFAHLSLIWQRCWHLALLYPFEYFQIFDSSEGWERSEATSCQSWKYYKTWKDHNLHFELNIWYPWGCQKVA